MSDLDLLALALDSKARNQLSHKDRAVHNWYRFVLSFPPHLVRHYLQRFHATEKTVVLDPFAGTGTTVVEAQKLGLPAVGIEANPMAHFACSVKIDWSPAPQHLEQIAEIIAEAVSVELELLPHLPPSLAPDAAALLFKDAISPRPLQKVLTLLGHIDRGHRCSPSIYWKYNRLALANAAVLASNLRFAPEVSVARKHKADAPVVDLWLNQIKTMVQDLLVLRERALPTQPAVVYLGDARQPDRCLSPGSVDVVITSPPYPNEKDYTRATRLESVLLGFLDNKAKLQAVKHDLVRSNSRSVYRDDRDDQWIQPYPQILELARTIDQRREELGKTSGFSRLYGQATRLYFGGMARHLANLRSVLRPGAQLAYVVGEQASYLQVHIPTGSLLAQIAQNLGYQLIAIDLFRTRRASKTDVDLREEVVLLYWPGL
ncbi:DNA methyltransferase [Leptolyngbya cf. ectocarpi LEGE 11479]|uniref:site-specific DNA-methyltransferase (cytosine-N(4)-specific) n=1 Tax=Leptolyngbya cf. ectocarpi LEGE 11479 TaxID=1828722 RepID=A0A929F9C4_LEPEC|nr:DNA methyltransferase [Leptolyngbya ectocarpi]MBE9067494.1 DNA methyltransferase [Leptolyngbya cf. ectocarpi LEGE 11479]